MTHLILFSHHLNEAYINKIKPNKVTVLVTKEQFKFVAYHQFRILYHLSAAKHFAKENNLQYSYQETWYDFFQTIEDNEIVVYYEPNDIWMKNQIHDATRNLNVKIEKDINFFFENIEEAFGKPPYKLNPMYQKWRKRLNILMDEGKPIGGQYSFDTSNRNRPPKTLNVPRPCVFDMDEQSQDIYEWIKEEFPDHPSSSQPFIYPVTANDANQLLDHFIKHRLPFFGKYQDAMMEGQPFMVHSLLSASINLGLLLAKEVVEQVCKAYDSGIAPIEAVEGFVRQVLGWREYIRGIYLIEMSDDYHLNNVLNNQFEFPKAFYHAKTSLRCLSQTLQETIDHAYNHHIQRLMIIGNISNLLRISPQDVRQWFNEMYIDSFDWVVTPNVMGMAMYADDGKMSTKPYISSANYIHKMSDYCKECIYDPKLKMGQKACPINALYYAFLNRHEKKLSANPRMKFMYMNHRKLSKEIISDMIESADAFIRKEVHSSSQDLKI